MRWWAVSMAQLQPHPPLPHRQIPSTPAESLYRKQAESNLRMRRSLLAQRDERALLLAADCLAAMASKAYGAIPALAGDSTPRRAWKRLSGEEGLPVENVCYMATCGHPSGRDAVAAFVGVLSAALDMVPRPIPDASAELHAAHAALTMAFARCLAAYVSAAADGDISEQERAEMKALHAELQRDADTVLAALHHGRRA